jgi:malate dehydrogenase (oxaloacetate-decarboxylating)(NADP+)
LKYIFTRKRIEHNLQDFSTDNAFKYLERFRRKYPVFNDDIQGTGAVVLSGFLNAANISSAASGLPLTSHRILFFGAGSAGVGVASQLMSFFTLNGLTEDQARRQIYLVDSQGLVYDARGRLAEHKKCMVFSQRYSRNFWLMANTIDFSRDDYQGPPMTDLLDVIEYVRPTALLGLSTITVAILFSNCS